MINSRALLILIGMFVFFAALVFKLADIQIVKSEELKYLAERQQSGVVPIEAERGLIFDRNNTLLVYNRHDVSFYVDLRIFNKENSNEVAALFSKTTGRSKKHYLNILSGKGKTVCLEKKLASEKADLIKSHRWKGFFHSEDPTRIYHYGDLASHVLGYVNTDYKGVNGIASEYNKDLSGLDGKRFVEKNAINELVSEYETIPPVAGSNIFLTINKNYQKILEEELEAGLQTYGGTSAVGILIDPNSGEVIALSNVKDYDPNIYWKYSDEQRRNRSITDTYEPGSTFKSITLAALIDKNLCKLNENIFVENGTYKFRNTRIKDTHPNKNLNVREILEESSNIGIAKLIQRMSSEDYFTYLRGFGFGTTTGIELPGEVDGTLRKPSNWSALSKVYLSFGYEIAVTPIQLAAAYCSLVNGGILYKPHIVKKVVNSQGELEYESTPKPVRRIISEKTSEIMRSLMVGVVEKGTGKNAASDMFSAGGKTGTSQKLINGKYSSQHYNSSFVGFFPADDPKLVCLILVNSPDKGRYGGIVAAPIFKNVTERIASTDKKILQEKFIDSKFDTNEFQFTNVKDDEPIKEIDEVKIDLNEPNLTMPDLRNCRLRDAISLLTKLGLKYKIKGSGKVKSQSIKAGKVLTGNETCLLECSEIMVKGTTVY